MKGDSAFSSKLLDMYSSIYAMRQDLERVKKPIGTRDNPARTCRDLFYGHPQFGDGRLISHRPPSSLNNRDLFYGHPQFGDGRLSSHRLPRPPNRHFSKVIYGAGTNCERVHLRSKRCPPALLREETIRWRLGEEKAAAVAS